MTPCYRASLQALPHALTFSTVSTGVVTFIMVLTVPFPVVYQAATEAGWTSTQIGSWFFAVLATEALMQLVLALGYRQPLAAGVAMVVDAGCVLASAAVATTMVELFTVLPVGMVRVVAGLAMLPVVVQAVAFSGPSSSPRFSPRCWTVSPERPVSGRRSAWRPGIRLSRPRSWRRLEQQFTLAGHRG